MVYGAGAAKENPCRVWQALPSPQRLTITGAVAGRSGPSEVQAPPIAPAPFIVISNKSERDARCAKIQKNH